MTTAVHQSSGLLARRRWLVAGQVQGVGFRPLVYRLARQLGLTGFVKNTPAGVEIEAQGHTEILDQFPAALTREAPALARIARIDAHDIASRADEAEFIIVTSDVAADAAHSATHVGDITIDTAVCPQCVEELLSKNDRRAAYGLINCTQCGPRYTIALHTPYDRATTTMREFAMCPACRKQYEDPADRRFHAQPIACHDCGPKVTYAEPDGSVVKANSYLLAADALLAGKIVAIKGIGAFHLAVRADDAAAVTKLRERKHREAKPLALMCRNLDEARKLVQLSPEAEQLLASLAAPIVLATRKADAPVAVDAVAPQSHRLGVMLPYTPMQHLLFAASPKLPALVMTSANATNEPLVIDNTDAIQRLDKLCDGLLWHNRPIARGVDDSVLIDMGRATKPIPIRRARGYVPTPIEIPVKATAHGVCVGGELKSTVAVVRGNQAILSQHLGDLAHPRTYHVFRQTIADLRELFAIKPAWIAHDVHPTYLSTVHAQELAAELAVPAIGVQHHHAHAAAVMAEHGIIGPVLAVVCDGTGYGTDGTIWGGELLLADLMAFRRLARLRPLRLPGGDASAKDPRRCAMALLHLALGDSFAKHASPRALFEKDAEREVVCGMIRGNISCAASSGAGRYFDGVAALLGVCRENSYEAQSAMALESSAAGHAAPATKADLFHLNSGKPAEIDFSPLINHLIDRHAHRVDVHELAALFHDQFARAWDHVLAAAVAKTGVKRVVLSGGVFCNALLTTRLTGLLSHRGVDVLRHEVVPPNDGGLSLGQAAVASARFAKGMIGPANSKGGG